MKVILQRVHSASVSVDQQLISNIGRGVLVFAAIGRNDTQKEVETMASKILRFKLWDSSDGKKWKQSVQEVGGEVLCVSQFTLYGATNKGNKPDFHKSASGETAKELYEHFIGKVRHLYEPPKVKDGVFQAMMDVSLVNDGPVTFELNVDAPVPL